MKLGLISGMNLGIRSRYLLIHVRFLALVYVSSAKSEHRFTQPLVRPFEGPKLHPRIAPTHPSLGRPTRHLNYSSSLSSVSTRLHPPSLLPAHPLSLCSSSTWSIPIPHTSSYVDPPSPHSLKTFCLLKLSSSSSPSYPPSLSVSLAVAPRIEPFHFKSGLQEGGRTRVACMASVGDLPIR